MTVSGHVLSVQYRLQSICTLKCPVNHSPVILVPLHRRLVSSAPFTSSISTAVSSLFPISSRTMQPGGYAIKNVVRPASAAEQGHTCFTIAFIIIVVIIWAAGNSMSEEARETAQAARREQQHERQGASNNAIGDTTTSTTSASTFAASQPGRAFLVSVIISSALTAEDISLSSTTPHRRPSRSSGRAVAF